MTEKVIWWIALQQVDLNPDLKEKKVVMGCGGISEYLHNVY